MKRAFVRGIWGDITKNGIRGGKIGKDIDLIRENKLSKPFITYVFGIENKKYLESLDFECILISPEPSVWDMIDQLYRHKLDIFSAAMEDYDEIVFLDWDCVPTAPLPDDFWDVMSLKSSFQANLFQYRTKKCLWRTTDVRKVTNGGFVYMRDKTIPNKIIKNYDEFYEWVKNTGEERAKQGKKLRFREKALIFDDEPAMSKYADDSIGGWQGIDKYWDLFEPEFCNLKKKSAFSDEQLKTKRECFVHWG